LWKFNCEAVILNETNYRNIQEKVDQDTSKQSNTSEPVIIKRNLRTSYAAAEKRMIIGCDPLTQQRAILETFGGVTKLKDLFLRFLMLVRMRMLARFNISLYRKIQRSRDSCFMFFCTIYSVTSYLIMKFREERIKSNFSETIKKFLYYSTFLLVSCCLQSAIQSSFILART